MTSLEHHIDPDPNMVIVLRNPCIVFAPWEEGKEGKEAAPSDDDWKLSRKKDKKKKKKKANKKPETRNTEQDEHHIFSKEDKAVGEAHTLFGDNPGGATGESSTIAQAQELTDPAAGPVDECDQEKPEGSIRYYVSSRHMVLASPWFRRALAKEGWAESGRNEKDGLIHIKADDWDSNAFLIVLNIIHLKNRDVPREVPLDELAKIAIVVDYYECAEAVELFTDIWKGRITTVSPVPSAYDRNLVLWIWIAWVLKWEQQFSNATLIAIKQCYEPIRSLGLPIPERVTEQIDLERYEAIESVIESLHDLREKYLDQNYICSKVSTDSFTCGSMLYGAISKGMHAIHILSPRPQIPFTDMSFDKLCTDVHNFQTASVSGNSDYDNSGFRTSSYGSGYYNNYPRAHHCNLTTFVKTVTDNVASTVAGLDI